MLNIAQVNISQMTAQTIIRSKGAFSEQKSKAYSCRDTFERSVLQERSISEAYTKPGKILPMPGSIFSDSYGYVKQKEITSFMHDYYTGNRTETELESYFRQWCVSMREYRNKIHQTDGNNETDNKVIISQMYEIFAKENARTARSANYEEGVEINSEYGTGLDDWIYYNADYHYRLEENKSALRSMAATVSSEWAVPGTEIDFDKIEQESIYTLDGGFDFNSGWNFIYRNQTGRGNVADESIVPPKGFRFFSKERVTPDADNINDAIKGIARMWMGKKEYSTYVPYQINPNTNKELIFGLDELFGESISDVPDRSNFINFLGKITVFSRMYSQRTGINDWFGG